MFDTDLPEGHATRDAYTVLRGMIAEHFPLLKNLCVTSVSEETGKVGSDVVDMGSDEEEVKQFSLNDMPPLAIAYRYNE